MHASPNLSLAILTLGLLIFLGSHSVRIVADNWRTRQIARWGADGWKTRYSVVALIGLALVVWGYSLTRYEPVVLWLPPLWTRHLAALLTLPCFILFAAVYVRGTYIKAAIGHPMVAGVKLWAFAHLLANGNLADVLLFGSFLLWAVFDFIASRRRDRLAQTTYPALGGSRDALACIVGSLIWAAFAVYGHLWLIGVPAFA